jgi:peptidyl-prolyl cis-trans isomerase B (cyclophilin B)
MNMINQLGMAGTVGMRGIAALVCALVAVSVLAGCRGKADTKTVVLPPPPPPGPKAIIKTRFGEMEMKFFPELAPRHVENFIKLAKSGFYNGTIFHRVIPGFMIQGGDPNTKNSLRKDTFGQGGPKDEKGNPIHLKAEFTDTPHKRGIVSMARAGEPDTAGSQFFIVVEDSFFLDRKYTVFGEVNKGLGIADKIAGLPRNEQDLPNDRIEMTVTIVE